MLHRTLACFQKRVKIVIPQLSPTLTKARIYKWCTPTTPTNTTIECYDPLFILECSQDLITPGYRDPNIRYPLMIVEAHDEGIIQIHDHIQLNEWYSVGYELGEIIDDDDDDDDDGTVNDWLWQAYSYTEDKEEEDKEEGGEK